MRKLYIVGNGFDRGHGLKTTYWDFRTYLGKYSEEFLVEFEKMYGIAPIDVSDWRIEQHYTEITENRNKRVKAILWQNFENDIASINIEDMMSFSSSIVESLDLESGLVGIEDTLNQYWENQYKFILDLQEYLYKWVRQVRLSKATQRKREFNNNSNDAFLSFNYTNTLEKVYRVCPEHVIHVHGGLTPFCFDNPIIGHGCKEKVSEYRSLAILADNEFDKASTSINNAIADYFERTLKDTDTCIARHRDFFNELIDVDEVTIIGHSLGKVDFPYFKLVMHKVKPNARWTVFYHTPEERATLIASLNELGLSNTCCNLLPTSDFWD